MAQAPMNSSATAPPAFIMAIDDSNSMTFQTLFPGSEGGAFWSNAGGFFITSPSRRLRTQADAFDRGNYVYVMPSATTMNGGSYAIPPLDVFGFARSVDYNPSYFNPDFTYPRWRKPSGTDGAFVDYPNAPPTAVPINPDDVAGAGTIDMTNNYRMPNAATDFRAYFMVSSGMTLPANTVYYMGRSANLDGNGNPKPSCGGLTGRASNVTTWTTLAAAHKLTDNCLVAIEYFPATYYSTSATPSAKSQYKATAVTEISNACGTGCTLYRYEIKPGNYTGDGYEKAITNYANWFSYYGNRLRAMKAALTISLEGIDSMTIGMFTINNRVATVPMRNMDVPSEKAALYNDEIRTFTNRGSTPNRFAVDHLGQQFMRKDAAAPVRSACQINAGMLFTDGYSNNSTGTAEPTVAASLSDSTMPVPLRDAHPNTLADIAAKYYLTNLRPDLPAGRVPVPKEACAANPNDPKIDCRRDPHMNFYALTLGAKGKIYGNTYNPATNSPDPFVTAPAWEAKVDSDPRTIDELWHATLNARGRYINSRTPADITDAMKSIIGSFGGGAAPAGGSGLSGSRVGSDTLAVEPEYGITNSSTDWYGRLRGSRLDASGNFVEAWEASAGLGAGRTIRYAVPNGGNVVPTVHDFSANNIGNNLDAVLCSDSLQNCAGKFGRITGGVTPAEAVAYLRGDRTHESGKLRKRTTLLGDIVNSTPLVTGATDDYGYTALDGDRLKYRTYLSAKASSQRKPFVYVGANDGMFHAFDGVSGREAFAFIPSTSIGHMGNLLFPYKPEDKLDQVFKHRYYVDGQFTAQDAYAGGSWKTVVVGSVGAGGRGVFALDVTDQQTLNVLWEITDKASLANGGADIGSVLGDAAIVPVKDAGGNVAWKAIFGNGYGSVNGKATLFVVDIATGAVSLVRAQEAGANAPTRSNNGLGNIVVVDRYTGTGDVLQQDGYADTVYGGDLNGAVWKFDLRKNVVALDGKPLFIARNKDDYTQRQPITGGFEATLAGENMMIFFGTGSFSFNADKTDKGVQSVYGLIDRGREISGRSELRQQFMTEVRQGTEVARLSTQFSIDVTQSGWFLNLGIDSASSGDPVATGERFVGNPRIWNGKLLFPSYDPVVGDGCSLESNNWLYGLDAVTGGAALMNATVVESGSVVVGGIGAIKRTSVTPTGEGSAGPTRNLTLTLSSRNSILPADDSGGGTPGSPGSPGGGGPSADKEQRCYVTAAAQDLPTGRWIRPCGRQSWRQLR
ncbi:PilC/PilY family type IV pilus protein [Lysobacter sp. Root690]|uniref:pilus assembly protein n=1 Tax=Lysobacter sp. Root690 TaxID=1736588 RepID=UPI00138F92AC|nr:PilC/PilY family type IV pilus protein [Lysobacter sp. Root690]